MFEEIKLTNKIPYELSGMRLDAALAKMFPNYSRARLQMWLKDGAITVDNQKKLGKEKIHGGEEITIEAVLQSENHSSPQNIDLCIVHDEAEFLIINKPAGLIVHPGAGNPDHTLVNALLYHYPDLNHLPRAGIIHRLDKDTTGLLIVAKTLEAQSALSKQLEERLVKREYFAIVNGILITGGTIDAPIGRHPNQRTKMAIVERGKPAKTHYQIQQRFQAHTALTLQLETGRTHQIRVHLASQRHPLIGDPTYGYRPQPPKGASPALQKALQQFPRQALHAKRLGFYHPSTGIWVEWETPLPQDLLDLLTLLSE